MANERQRGHSNYMAVPADISEGKVPGAQPLLILKKSWAMEKNAEQKKRKQSMMIWLLNYKIKKSFFFFFSLFFFIYYLFLFF